MVKHLYKKRQSAYYIATQEHINYSTYFRELFDLQYFVVS